MIDLPADQLARVREIIGRHVHGAEVCVFGSRVSGRAKKFSGLDLMIKVNGGMAWRTMADLRESFEASDLPIMVDVVDRDSCSAQFRNLVGAQLLHFD